MKISKILCTGICGEEKLRRVRLLFQSSEMKLVRGFVKASKGVSFVLLLKELILPHGGKKEKWFVSCSLNQRHCGNHRCHSSVWLDATTAERVIELLNFYDFWNLQNKSEGKDGHLLVLLCWMPSKSHEVRWQNIRSGSKEAKLLKELEKILPGILDR